MTSAVVTAAKCQSAARTRITLNVTISYNLTDPTLPGMINLSFTPLLVYGTCLLAGSQAIIPEPGAHTVLDPGMIDFAGQFGVECAGRTSITDEIYAISVGVLDLTNAAFNIWVDFPFYADIHMTR